MSTHTYTYLYIAVKRAPIQIYYSPFHSSFKDHCLPQTHISHFPRLLIGAIYLQGLPGPLKFRDAHTHRRRNAPCEPGVSRYFSGKSQMVTISGSAGQTAPVTRTQLCHRSMKVDTDNTETNECGPGPARVHFRVLKSEFCLSLTVSSNRILLFAFNHLRL